MIAHREGTLGTPNLSPQAVVNYNDRSVMQPAQRPEHLVPMAPPVTTVATAPPVHAGAYPTVNVNVNTPMMPMISAAPTGPSMIVRVLWYVFIGWWLSAVVIVLGYALMLTVIGIPVAFALFNRIPQALTLRARTVRNQVDVRDGVGYVSAGTERQRPWYWRALYFLLIGWWFGAVWLVAAWLIGLLIITLPITFLMYNRTSGVMTLQRH
jgi:uncharacterized membrane protein YccF (DUF307 family)